MPGPVPIPPDATPDLQKALRQIEIRLAALEGKEDPASVLPDAIKKKSLEDRVAELENPIPGPEWGAMVGDGLLHAPGLTPDTYPNSGFGHERVLHADGTWRRVLDGILQVIPEGLDGIIAERRLVLLGSLAIGSGLSVDSIFARLGRFAALDVLSDVTVGGQPQKFARMLSSQVDDKPSSGTGATDAHTYQIPANTLQTDGDILIIHAGGTFTSNSNNKTWKLFFDGTAQLNVTNAAASATMWSIEAWVTRKSSSSAIVTARTARYNNAQAVFDNPAQFLDASVDYTAAIDIKTQVQMATSGTTTETYFSVIYVPAT